MCDCKKDNRMNKAHIYIEFKELRDGPTAHLE